LQQPEDAIMAISLTVDYSECVFVAVAFLILRQAVAVVGWHSACEISCSNNSRKFTFRGPAKPEVTLKKLAS